MLSPLLVPLDGSALAERALVPARALARQTDAQLHLLRVAVPMQIFVFADAGLGVLYPDQSLVEAHKEAERYLGSLSAACDAEGLETYTDVREGEVAGTLVNAAREAHARLILMSSHGYSGVRRWLLGSVARKVLDAAPCPVWVVRTPDPPRHLLIPLDGSLLAEEVLVPALAVARIFGARVSLLRVVPEVSHAELARLEHGEHGLSRRLLDEMNAHAADYLALIADRFGDETEDLHTAVRSGPAAETILEYAERHNVDLVAMTTHGRTGLRRWIYGSVTQKLLDQLPVSMLVARSSEVELA
jgi:nucleotide-binding universal stress UspA family protein